MRSASIPSARLLLAAALFLSLSSGAWAQSGDTAGLEVDVHDANGALLADAQLTLINQATHVTRQGVTGSDGIYRFVDIPVGNYTLAVDHPGFSELVESGISLTLAQSAALPVTLKVSSVNQEITVSSEVPMVDTNRTTTGQTISSLEIENLPSNGRDFTAFALTVPGVTPQATSGQGSGLSINGQRGRSNNILIDGVENNGQLNGTVRQTLSLDAIAEFQVMTNQFLPEYGDAGGGLINLVTKTGSDEFHGDAYYFARNAALNAHPYCFVADCPAPVYVQNDMGATLGGPLDRSKKTVFFASGEYFGLNTNLVDDISSATTAGVNAILALRPLVNGGVTSVSTSNSIPLSTTQTLASLRVDHNFNVNNTVTARLLYGKNNNNNSALDRDDGAYSDTSDYGHDMLSAYNLTGVYTHVFNPNLLNEIHFQYSPQKLSQLPNDPIGPSIYIENAIQFGRNTEFPTLLNETHYEWIDALTWSKGHHVFKVGTDEDWIRANTSFPTDFGGLFSFTCVYSANPAPGFPTAPAGASTCIDNLEDGKPFQFVQGFGQPQINLPDWLLAWYAEDSWKISPRLTMNYGLRYDIDLQPQGYNNNLNNPIEAPLPKGIPREYHDLGPRLGLAWAVDKKGNTVLRAGYGMFYDKIFLLVARNALLARNTLTESTVAEATAQFASGPFPQSTTYPTGLTPVAPSINSIANTMPIPYAEQASLYLDQALSGNWALEIGSIYVSGAKELKSSNVNLLPPTILTPSNSLSLCGCTPSFQQLGRPYYSSGRINPSFDNIQEVGSWGHSRYSAMQASIVRRATNSLALRASWIWSKEIDDASDFTQAQQPDNPYYPHGERSIGNEDQRNRFAAAGVYTVPYRTRQGGHNSALRWVFGDWIGSGIATVFSGSPYNLTVGSDVNNDTNADSDRPYADGMDGLQGGYIAKRNDFRGPRQQNLSLRLQRKVRLGESRQLEFSAESFNTLNHANFNSVNTIWGNGAAPENPYPSAISTLRWGTVYHQSAAITNPASVFGAFGSTNVTSTTMPGQREIQLAVKLMF